MIDHNINDCYRIVKQELEKIACFDISTDVGQDNVRHYIADDGLIYEESIGDRGAVYVTKVGTAYDLISMLLYRKIRDFAFDYECHHRRRFEDSRRQVNEIIVRCYGYLDGKYEYKLMTDLSDNISICFDLLEHYIKVCKKLIDKRSIPEKTMRHIRLIADKEYASKTGGMYDVAFALDYVRYNVSEILSGVPLPALAEELHQYEEQYRRLLKLEKDKPHQPDRYPLGLWDNDVFREAEDMLNGKSLKDGASLQCALYLLMNAVRNDRAVGLSIEMCFHKDIEIGRYRAVLDEIFLADKYGVYFFGPTKNFSQERKDKLTFRLLCGDAAERQL